MEKASPLPVRRYSDGLLAVIDNFRRGWESTDALSCELSPGAVLPTSIPVWGVALDRAGIIVAGIVKPSETGRTWSFAIHQGDRQTASHWLRLQGVPAVRISFKLPKGASPIRWNPSFREVANV